LSHRYLIVNADDFGASEGVNRGIIECHVDGILTSTSMMVTGRAAREAAELGREHPDLSIGLHWDCWGEDEREFDLTDETAIREEFERQLDEFRSLMGRDPTHVDTHRHAHRKWDKELMPLFSELVEPLGVPLRDDGRVRFVGDFYAQWKWRVTNLEYVSVPFLQLLLRDKVGDGWTEVSCHPGYRSPGYSSIYMDEREVEVRTLTDPRIRLTVEELGIDLVGYDAYPEASR
jgi:chitin disaccharide deacetylase